MGNSWVGLDPDRWAADRTGNRTSSGTLALAGFALVFRVGCPCLIRTFLVTAGSAVGSSKISTALVLTSRVAPSPVTGCLILGLGPLLKGLGHLQNARIPVKQIGKKDDFSVQ